MLRLAARNLMRRPLRSGLTLGGVATAVAVLACIFSFGQGYERGLRTELDRMGLQLMLVPLGCPYDAASRVLKGKTLENSLPESAVEQARTDPAVAVAAPLLMAALVTPGKGRADMWVGLDQSAVDLKPWWRAAAGANWFTGPDSVLLGCDAAEVETRGPGDAFFSPETGKKFRVAGVLQRSGTSDDSLFFVPLRTAQAMFNQPGRVTAIAVRLRDPALLREAADRLQRIAGAQVVTMTEMMGTFLNLVGVVRTLLLSIALVAVGVSVLSVFNTLLAAVLERTSELSVMRAVGASRAQLIGLIAAEGLLLTVSGSVAGLAAAAIGGGTLEQAVKEFVPFAPNQPLFWLTPRLMLECLALGAAAGVLGGCYPAWRACRLEPAQALQAD